MPSFRKTMKAAKRRARTSRERWGTDYGGVAVGTVLRAKTAKRVGRAMSRAARKLSDDPFGNLGKALGLSNPRSRQDLVRHSIGYPTKGEALEAKKRLELRGGGPYKIHREGRSGYTVGYMWSVVGPRAANPAGPSAIPTRWTKATVSRKGGQIQIRMGGR